MHTPQDEVQPTVASVFGRLVNPIGVQQPRGHRNSRSNPTVGSEPVPVVLQGVTEPNRGNSVVSGVFGAPDLVEGPVFSSELKEPDSNVTRRSNASARTSGSLRRAQNAERRNPDFVFPSPGPIGTVPEPDSSRDMVPGQARRPPPDPDEQQGVLDYSQELDHTNDGSVIERRWAKNMEKVCVQLEAVTAQLSVMSTGKKQPRVAAGAGDGGHGGSSDDSSDSKDSYRPRKGRTMRVTAMMI